jgi:hypothetical protein
MTKALWTSFAIGALVLAGCGGGGGDAPAPVVVQDPTVQVPPSASESPSGMVGSLTALGAADAEVKEPVALDSFEPKTTEEAEPDPLS